MSQFFFNKICLSHKLRYLLVMVCLVSLIGLVFLSGCQQSIPKEVVVYVAVDRANAEPILNKFEKEYGIKVRAVYDTEVAKTTGLVTRILAEADRPRCDVFWNNEFVQTMLLKEKQLLEPYDSPNAIDIPERFKDSEHYWASSATRCRVLVYHTKHVSKEELPNSIFDLTHPKWKGKIAIANPQFGTTRTHLAALFAEHGEQKSTAYLNELLQNDVRIVDGNAVVMKLVAQANPSASPIYLGLTDTDDVLAGQAENLPIEMIFPDQQHSGTLLIPTSVSLVKNAPHPKEARLLIDYLLSEEVEVELTANDSGYIPVRPHLPLPDFLPEKNIHTIKASYAEIYDQLESSSEWTRQHFQKAF